MEKLEEKVTPTPGASPGSDNAREEVSRRQLEIVASEKKTEEKPEASEQIVIEEISIDGMCGVY